MDLKEQQAILTIALLAAFADGDKADSEREAVRRLAESLGREAGGAALAGALFGLLAERAGLSERTFHRRFFSATGQTPARFVEAARLDAARILLSRGTTLKRVAAQVGLFPASRLARAFERRFGLSPRLYREMHADA